MYKKASHQKDLGIDTYFYGSRSPWQKGVVENMKDRIIPKHKRPYFLKQKDLDQIADILLNNTTRQVLGFKTPNEVILCKFIQRSSRLYCASS